MLTFDWANHRIKDDTVNSKTYIIYITSGQIVYWINNFFTYIYFVYFCWMRKTLVGLTIQIKKTACISSITTWNFEELMKKINKYIFYFGLRLISLFQNILNCSEDKMNFLVIFYYLNCVVSFFFSLSKL